MTYFTPKNDRRLGWFIDGVAVLTLQWWLAVPLTVYLLWAGHRAKRVQHNE